MVAYTGVEIPGPVAATRESAGPYTGVEVPGPVAATRQSVTRTGVELRAFDYALFGVPEPPALGWRARVKPTRSEAHTITAVSEPQVDLAHSAMSSFSATVPYSESLIDELGAEVDLYYRSEQRDRFVSRMTYEAFGSAGGGANNDAAATMSISGRGPLSDLDRGEITVLYDQLTVADAIRDFTDAHTNLSWAVIDPPEEPVTDEQLAFAQADAAADDPAANPSPFEGISPGDRDHPFGEGSPIYITEAGLTAHPVSYLVEGEDAGGDGTVVSDGSASGGEALDLDAADDSATWSVEVPWALGDPQRARRGSDAGPPTASVALRVRNPGGSAADIELRAADEQVDTKRLAAGAGWSWYQPAALDTAVGPGSVSVEVTKTNDGGTARIDAAVVYDSEYAYTWPDSTGANDALAGPEPYPVQIGGLFDGQAADAMIDAARLDYAFDSANANAEIGAFVYRTTPADSESGFDVTAERDYRGAPGTSGELIDVLAGIDPATRFQPVVRLASSTDPNKTTSPTQRTEIQTLTELGVSFDGRSQPVINAQTFSGSPLSIVQELHDSGNLRFTYQHGRHPNNASIDVESFPTGHAYQGPDGADSWVVEDYSRAASIKGYANRVTVVGARRGTGGTVSGGGEDADPADSLQALRARLRQQYTDRQAGSGAFVSATVEDEAEIEARADALGVPYEQAVIEHTITDRSLLTDPDCRSRARSALPELLANDEAGGEMTIAPKLVLPGYSYAAEELGASEGEEIALESVSIAESPGESSATLSFSRTAGFVDALAQALDRGR